MSIDLSSLPNGFFSILEIGANLHSYLDISTQGLTLAQQFENVDILGNIQGGWDNFLKTGQAGALAIGLVVGYMVRGITR